MPLAGKSTLNRLELTPAGASADSRYKKIVASIAALQDALVDVFIRLKAKQGVPTELVLDLDATDDPVHGAGEVLPRLLQELLLPAAVHILW